MNDHDDLVSELLEDKRINDIYWMLFGNEKNRAKGFRPVALVVALLVTLAEGVEFERLHDSYMKLTDQLPTGTPHIIPPQMVPPAKAYEGMERYINQLGKVDDLNLKILETAVRLRRAGRLRLKSQTDDVLRVYEFLPQGPGTGFFESAITANLTGRKLGKKKNISVVEMESLDGKWIAEYRSDNAYYKITNERLRKTVSQKQVASTLKVFNFILTKANRQNFSEDIEFSLQELVDRGIYKSKDTAYRGIKKSIDILRGFEIEGAQFLGNKEIRNLKSYVFVLGYTSYTNCTVRVIPEALTKLCHYYGRLPVGVYALPGKTYRLANYIYRVARRNLTQIGRSGTCNISLKAINVELGHPDPEETTHHTQSIINPMLAVITDVNKADIGIRATPVFETEYKTAKEFLRGFIRVEFDNEFIEHAKARTDIKREKILETIKKRGDE